MLLQGWPEERLNFISACVTWWCLIERVYMGMKGIISFLRSAFHDILRLRSNRSGFVRLTMDNIGYVSSSKLQESNK